MKKTDSKTAILSKQKRIIAILLAFICVLAVLYFLVKNIDNTVSVTLPLYDDSGDYLEYTANSASGTVIRVYFDKDGNRLENKNGAYSVEFSSDSEIKYSSRPYIFPEIPLSDISEVTVKKGDNEFTVFVDKNTSATVFKNNEMLLYDNKLVSELLLQARFMIAIQKLDGEYNDEQQLAGFGLDGESKPLSVSVKDVNGNMYEVLFGSKLVDGTNYYAKDVNKPYVYVVDSTVSALFRDENEYYMPIIAPSMKQNEYNYMDKFIIHKNGEMFISVERVPEEIREQTADTDLHKIVYPARYPASITKFYEALSYFENLSGTRVIETNVYSSGEENKEYVFEKYGFNVPSNTVYWSYGEKENLFLTGKQYVNDAGEICFYAYSPYMDTVVELPVLNAPFLQYELIDFINTSVFQININHLKSLSVETERNNCNFVFENSGENLVVKDTVSGKTVDTASFRQFYISLLTTRIEGYGDTTDITGGKDLVFEVETTYGDRYLYEFDTISTTRALITLDGSSNFYTNRGYVSDAVKKLEMLMNGEVINSNF